MAIGFWLDVHAVVDDLTFTQSLFDIGFLQYGEAMTALQLVAPMQGQCNILAIDAGLTHTQLLLAIDIPY